MGQGNPWQKQEMLPYIDGIRKDTFASNWHRAKVRLEFYPSQISTLADFEYTTGVSKRKANF